MLIQFSIKNFKVFKDKTTLSMVASNYDKETRESDNIIEVNKFSLRLLKSAVIYGANASGKSKLIEAFVFFKNFIETSSKNTQIGDLIEIDPFRLSSETEKEPSEFEIIFLHQNILYRYGFVATKKRIVSEWLYYRPNTKEIQIFYRENNNFEMHSRIFSKGKTVVNEKLVRENALLLSVAAQFNDKIAIDVIEWLSKLRLLSGLHEHGFNSFTLSKVDKISQKNKILELLKAADLSISDIKLQKFDFDKLPPDFPKELKETIFKKSKKDNLFIINDVLTSHKKYDANKKATEDVGFSLDKDESSGTQQFFYLTGPILDVLENGYCLVVDELDSKLHPKLVSKIVSLFNSKELNPKNAQLIFNTHDTNLLNERTFRRDQIWFTEKNKYGEAKLYSLSDFKSTQVKKDESFEDNYLKGKYGAVPFLNEFDSISNVLFQNLDELNNESKK